MDSPALHKVKHMGFTAWVAFIGLYKRQNITPMSLISQLTKTVSALISSKCEQSLNVCDIATSRYICYFMEISCDYWRHCKSVKRRIVCQLTNIKLQNAVHIRIFPIPFIALPSTTTRFVHKDAIFLPTVIISRDIIYMHPHRPFRNMQWVTFRFIIT